MYTSFTGEVYRYHGVGLPGNYDLTPEGFSCLKVHLGKKCPTVAGTRLNRDCFTGMPCPSYIYLQKHHYILQYMQYSSIVLLNHFDEIFAEDTKGRIKDSTGSK